MMIPAVELLFGRLSAFGVIGFDIMMPGYAESFGKRLGPDEKQSARWLRCVLGDPSAPLALAVYRFRPPFEAFERDGYVYGIDHQGVYKISLTESVACVITPEELFASAPEPFGLWDRFATHLETTTRRFLENAELWSATYPNRSMH